WLTGVFDDLNRLNTLSYPQEIFEISGLQFQGEKYLVELDDSPPFRLDLPRPLVGLNTGAGARWPSRLWKFEHWAELIRRLRDRGLGVLLLGGPDEDEKNRRLAAGTGAAYLGTFPLKRFFHLVNEVDVMVTGVTMALHIGIGLEKRVVLMNAIFNRREFEMYGLGRIVEPDVDCLGCFKPVCEKDCINLITPEDILQAVLGELPEIPAQAGMTPKA
ncbi:MAG: glycosyltransferase family 9 protein, partial [Candidatus Zixiibacteriota bacterium]